MPSRRSPPRAVASLRRVRSPDRLALCYHAVSDDWSSHLAVATARFERQVRSLLDHGYRAVTFTDLVTAATDGRTFAVTFDDAYASVDRYASPILERLGVVATVFVPTDYVDAGEPATWRGMERWVGTAEESELELMRWDELRALAAAGWEIGSHTRSHARLTELAGAELDAELRGSRDVVEDRLQRACRSVAYPYGGFDTDVDRATARAAAAAGYDAGCTVPRRLWPPEPLLWPRVAVDGADSHVTFRTKIAQPVRLFRATRAWPALSAPRRVIRDRLVQAPERRVQRARRPR
jgi:peptidoglycan/xylan/chitin deacetylase (PgdA/CDA1 family)